MVHIEIPYTRAVHCGVIINAGSRDEFENEIGMAHFIEHMIFKGTSNRKTFHILNYLESVGGDLNAYTTKEKTCLYASIPSEHFNRAADLLADITFNSTFPEKEILKEKQVISEEIDMYRDTPEEAIFEDFDYVTFPKHPLGHPILGTKETIESFDREGLKKFVNRNYAAEGIVFSVVGNVPFKKVVKTAEKLFGDRALPPLPPQAVPNDAYTIVKLTETIPTQQSHRLIGGLAYPLRKGRYVPFYLLNNYLGGPANNSLLSLNIREKYGLSYNIYSFYSAYSDAGSWGVYFGCEPKNTSRIDQLVRKELDHLRNTKIGSLRLNQIKKQMIGQMILGYEQPVSQMLAMGKNIIDFDNHYLLSELISQVEAVTAEAMLEAAQEIFHPGRLSVLSYLPES